MQLEIKTEGVDFVVSRGPMPKNDNDGRQKAEHQEHQTKGREDAGELWTDHDLVFTTSIGTPIEPRSLNTHWEGVRVQAGLPGVRLHDYADLRVMPTREEKPCSQGVIVATESA